MIRVAQAGDAYNREDAQQNVNAIIELQKLVMALSAFVPQTDIDTGENKKLVIDAGVVTVVDP